jgi:hypothetical protein
MASNLIEKLSLTYVENDLLAGALPPAGDGLPHVQGVRVRGYGRLLARYNTQPQAGGHSGR